MRGVAPREITFPQKTSHEINLGDLNLEYENSTFPQRSWTLQWKGERTCITQGCFGPQNDASFEGTILRVFHMPVTKRKEDMDS